MKPFFDDRNAPIGARSLLTALRELLIGGVNVSSRPVNLVIGRVKTSTRIRETPRRARELPRRPRGPFSRSMTSFTSSIMSFRSPVMSSRVSIASTRTSLMTYHTSITTYRTRSASSHRSDYAIRASIDDARSPAR